MTVRIPQYTIENQTNKSYKSIMLIMLLILIAGFIFGYVSSNFYVKKSLSGIQERNDLLDTVNLELQGKINTLLSEITILKTDKKVKTEATLQLQNQYQQLLKTIDELNSNISFYEHLLNPSSNNKGLRVFKAQLKDSADDFELNLSLAQKLERAKSINGSLKIIIKGSLADKALSINVDMKQQTKYKFKYFQTLSYRFSLPEGFKPEQLIVELTPSIKKAKKIKQSYSWDEIIKG